LSGKPQLDTNDVSRPADEPAKLTVLLPVTMVPLKSGTSLGAKETPGGVGRCGWPFTSVPVLPAGRLLMRTRPPPPKTALIPAPMAAPVGSKTTPMKG
jgi:hypothetical protein